jgi:phosphoribosylformimino-5-aminoimidazole carboxamide ribotide isomerase
MKFRPCIDLHNGTVKQIVGGTLTDNKEQAPVTNFVSPHSPSYYARMYRQDNLSGGHVIMLGPGNETVAEEALAEWPGGLQIGGGINTDNAASWLDRGASAVIVTSYVFRDGLVNWSNLEKLAKTVGKKRLVLDLSCRKRDEHYFIVTDRWQKFTSVEITQDTLASFSAYCSEFLIHAADVEGLCRGVEVDLVENLGKWVTIPTTYAGGAYCMDDVRAVMDIGQNRLDITVGSALDIFGGSGIKYRELVDFLNKP